MKATLLSLFTASLLLLSAQADPIRIVGSDLLQDALSGPLETLAADKGLELDIQMYGSIPALSQLRSDEADLAFVASPDDESDFQVNGYEVLPFTYQVAVVVVSSSNTISQLSFKQLAGIFGALSEQNLGRWGDIGITGALATRSIQPVMVEVPNSVVRELFKSKILDRGAFKSNMLTVENFEEKPEMLISDTGAIAIFPTDPQNSNLTALSISSDDPNAFAYGPTRENVFDGSYSLRLPFYLVFKAEKKQEMREILRFMFGNDVTKSLVDNDFMPLPENIRKRSVLELDMGS